MKRKILAVTISIMIVAACVMTGCGGASAGGNSYYEYPMETTAAYSEEYYTGGGELAPDGSDPSPSMPVDEKTQEAAQSAEKLVYTCYMTIQTTEYAATMDAVEKSIAQYAGFIESRQEYDNDSRWYYEDYHKNSGTLNCTLTVRIPSEQYRAFLESLDGQGKITSKTETVENISKVYHDTEAVIEALVAQQKRLLAMMDQAATIEDMITIETRLTEVEAQLNAYRTQLSGMDTDVRYSTVTLSIQEVLEYSVDTQGQKTNTFGDRLKNTLTNTWEYTLKGLEYILYFVIYTLPVAVVAGIILLIVLLIVRSARRKKAAKKVALASGNGQKPEE